MAFLITLSIANHQRHPQSYDSYFESEKQEALNSPDSYHVLDVSNGNKLKRMDKYCALSVRGYIRCAQRELQKQHSNTMDISSFQITRSIIDLCLLYYDSWFDDWDSHGFTPGMCLDPNTPNGCTVKAAQHSTWRLYKNAYLRRICVSPNPLHQRKCPRNVYRWTFKIAAYDGSNPQWNMLIGIRNFDSGRKIFDFSDSFTGSGHCYAFVSSAGEFTDHTYRGGYVETPISDKATPCRTGDIIEMTLDTESWELCYDVNGIYLGRAFRVVPGRYEAAITIDVVGNAIQSLW